MINENNFNFPIYLKNIDTLDFYRYSDGNQVLEFNNSCIHSHCAPYLFNTKKEFLTFLKIIMSRANLIVITKKEFHKELDFAKNWIINIGFEPLAYWSKEMIHKNIRAIQINERKS